MQTVSSLYTQLLRQIHTVEVRAVIGNDTYDMDRIVDVKVASNLFPDSRPSVGACIAAQLDITVIPITDIPGNAEIQLFARLSAGAQHSEWLPQGVFFVFRRGESTLAGDRTVKCTAYDCIAKLGRKFITGTIIGWPKTMRTVATEIAQRLGVSIDARTTLSNDWLCQIDTTMTMEDYMRHIAAAHCGSWISSPVGELRLVSAFDLPQETSLLVDETGSALVFGDTRILIG